MLGNLLLILSLPVLSTSNPSVFYSYTVKEDSWLSLSGSSTVNNFECISNSEISKGDLKARIIESNNSIHFSNAFFQINVKSFDCSNPLLNRDLYKALGVEKNPYISIELLEAFTQKQIPSKQKGSLKALVSVTINGKCKIVEVPIDWQRVDEFHFRFAGAKGLNMSDFDIDPPSPAFGLVKVNNEIVINFSLIVEATAYEKTNNLTETLIP